MENRVVVYADFREEKSGIPRLIEVEGIPVVRKNLPIGDYVISGDIVVERKTAWDFVHSLFDGRLFDQARRMSEEYNNIIYIIEGNPYRIKRYRSRVKQIYAAAVALLIDYDAKIIYTEGPSQSAYVIVLMARRIAKGERRGVIVRKKGKIESISDWQQFVLQSFPGVGTRTANKIMERFRNLREFCSASISELASVDGIGEKRAEQIFTILNRKFEKHKNKQYKTLQDFYKKDV